MVTIIFSLFSVNMIGITVAQADHDIAVVSVTPSPTSVRLGELVNITVVVKNNGTVAETFNTTVYYGTTAIETKTVQNLTAGLTTPLTFTWNTNTTDVREEVHGTTTKQKSYTINATASTVPGETDTGDNTLLSSPVTIKSYYITVLPQRIVDPNLIPGKNFTVSIYTDYNGTDVWSWQFTLSYNPLVLHGVNVTNGDLITTEKHEKAKFDAGTFNNTAGILSLTMAWLFYPPIPVPTTSGPGILANVTFTVVGTGDSDITVVLKEGGVARTKLVGWTEEGEDYKIIDYRTPDRGHILDGFFQNIEVVTHDIAVTSVTLSSTSVEKGELVNISVTVKNNGTVNEDVTVEVYRSIGPYEPGYSPLIDTKTAPNLGAGANTSLTFAWNTTYVTVGNYTITAVANVPGDTDTLQSEEIVTVKAREEQPLPILQIILVIGIVAVVVLVVVTYAFRRR